MDDPNITMEEYIRLKEEKAHRCGKVYNWETAKYGKIGYDEDVHDLKYVETEYPAIRFADAISSDESNDEDYTPMVSYFNDLDFFKDFENDFPAIVYNDALTSKLDFLMNLRFSIRRILGNDTVVSTSYRNSLERNRQRNIDAFTTHILAHKLNLENLPSKISGEFLILILLIPVFNVLSIQRGRCIIQVGDGN
ncbi:hypothetical protein Tco_0685794 [Tanacetum coccineum]